MIISMFMIVIIVTVIWAWHYYWENRPTHETKLLVLPVLNAEEISSDESWLKIAIPHMISTQLSRNISNPDILVIPHESIYRSIPYDSLSSKKYISKLFRFTKINYLVQCRLYKSVKDFSVNVEIIDDANRVDIFKESFSSKKLENTIINIAQQISEKLDLDNAVDQRIIFNTDLNTLEYYYMGLHDFLIDSLHSAYDYGLKATENDASFAYAYKLMAECLMEDAIAAYEGEKASANYEFQKIKAYLIKSIEYDSTLSDSYRLLADVYQYDERWSRADELLDRATILDENNANVYVSMSRMHASRYKKYGFDSEEELYQKALSMNPFKWDTYILLSDFYLFTNKSEKAESILQDYLNINPNSIPVLMALSKNYIVNKKFADANKLVKDIIRKDPYSSDGYYNQGVIYYNLNKYNEARQSFLKAIELDNHKNSYLYLAYISELEGNKQEAIYYLRRRIHYRTGTDDEFAEEARIHLVKLLNEEEK